MKSYQVSFAAMDWETPAVGVRQKVLKQGEKSLRLLQIDQDLDHPEWCTVGHTGYVLDETLEVTFENQKVIYTKGDGLIIPSGNSDKHKPRALTASVTLILIDEVLSHLREGDIHVNRGGALRKPTGGLLLVDVQRF